MGDNVRFVEEGRVGRVTLDRPEQGNRVDVATMQDLIAALREAHASDTTVLVIDAIGEDFSLGRDQEERPTGMSKRDNLSLILAANDLLLNFQGITVASVHGRALGFGSGVITLCDLSIASDEARFGFTEIQHGFAPAIVMTYLETFVNRKVALDLLLTGRVINAVEAHRIGLLSQVVPRAQLEAVVQATVSSLLDKPIAALRQCKFLLRELDTVAASTRGRYALDAMTADDSRS